VSKSARVTFRTDGKAILTKAATKDGSATHLATFRVRKSIRTVELEFGPTDARVLGDDPAYAMEFLSDDELLLSESSWKGKGVFARLAGRLKRQK
jgi:hypothetical protein